MLDSEAAFPISLKFVVQILADLLLWSFEQSTPSYQMLT